MYTFTLEIERGKKKWWEESGLIQWIQQGISLHARLREENFL